MNAGSCVLKGLRIYFSRVVPIAIVRVIAMIAGLMASSFGLKNVIARAQEALALTPEQIVNPDILKEAVRNLSPDQLISLIKTPALWFVIVVNIIISIWAQAGVLLAIYPNDKANTQEGPRTLAKVLIAATGLFFPLLVLDVSYAVVTGVGFLVLVIPGIWLLVKYCLAPLLLVVEDQSSFGALGRSSELVAGNWFGVFGGLLVISLITLVPMFALPRLFGTMGAVAANLFFSPLYSCCMLAVLESLRGPKDSVSPA